MKVSGLIEAGFPCLFSFFFLISSAAVLPGVNSERKEAKLSHLDLISLSCLSWLQS